MKRYYGKYRGICRDIHDPKMVGRIRVEVPYPLGKGKANWSTWAYPCLPPGHFELPKEGDRVWVEFLDGNPNNPIWTGVWFTGAGPSTTAPFQSVHEALTDMNGAEADPDKEDHANEPVDDAEHREWHDHSSTFYSPHRFGRVTPQGNALEFNDHPGKKGYVRLVDRFARILEMTAQGILRLRSAPDPQEPTRFHQLLFADHLNEGEDEDAGPGRFIELRDMAGQNFRMNADEGAESIRLVDAAGQSVILDVNTATITVTDAAGNFVELKDGQVTVTSNGNVIINVPDGSNVHIGGEGGQALATRAFVEQQYNTHTHVSGAPGSPTSPPMTPSPLVPGNDITDKQRSE